MHSKKGKGTTMNKLYNTPFFKEIPLGSANMIYDSASLLEIKRKMKFQSQFYLQKEKRNYSQ